MKCAGGLVGIDIQLHCGEDVPRCGDERGLRADGLQQGAVEHGEVVAVPRPVREGFLGKNTVSSAVAFFESWSNGEVGSTEYRCPLSRSASCTAMAEASLGSSSQRSRRRRPIPRSWREPAPSGSLGVTKVAALRVSSHTMLLRVFSGSVCVSPGRTAGRRR